MPRQVRIDCEGAFYHVIARGNRSPLTLPHQEEITSRDDLRDWKIKFGMSINHTWYLFNEPSEGGGRARRA